jgi:class 3 adenylate cyclase
MTLSNLSFFSLKKKLLVLVLSASLSSIIMTTILFLNFEKIPFFEFEENIIGIGLALMVGISIITIFLSKRLSEPLIRLSDAANKIAGGDFDVRTNIKSYDEIGQLSRSFDTMAKNLQDSLRAVNLREEIIKQQEDILLRFSENNEKCCVCIVDIIQSTMLTSHLSNEKIEDFYGIFINSLSEIVKKFNGIVVKNIGDSLLFYFPKIEPGDKDSFKNILECCLAISKAHEDINKKMNLEELPGIAYRTSITYGTVSIAKVATSSVNDIFGSTVNRCSKINRFALPNTVIIGSDLYENVKSLKEYDFRNMNVIPTGTSPIYSVFLVTRK